MTTAASTSTTPGPGPGSARAGSPGWLPWLPLAAIVVWWVGDLRFQWKSIPEYRFGPIVVLLTAYLAWERWPTRPRDDRPAPALWSLLLAAAGFPLVLLAELYKNGIARAPSASFTLSVGCLLFAAAVILQAGGRRTLRHFFFPILFFFVAVPLPKLFWNPVVFGLQSFVTFLNVETLRLMGIAAEQQGHIIKLPRDVTVGVDEACSGVRSLQSSIMAALFIGDLVLRRTSGKVFFLVAGVGLAVLGNFCRSLYLSLTAHQHGTDALKAVHDAAGWSVLVFTAVGVSVLAWFTTRLERRLTELQRAHGARPAAPKTPLAGA